MAFEQAGIEAVIKNFGGFMSNLDRMDKGIQNLGKSADHIGGNFSKLSSSAGTFGTVAGKLGQTTAHVAGDMVNLGGSLLKVGAIAGGAALTGLVALGAGLTAVTVGGVRKAADLDDQMSAIAATMNTTKDAVGPLKDLIFDLALNPNLTVNSTEAANAIQLLAQNGVDAKDIIDGAAASTVALANATGADFAVAADIASGVMKVFNIEAGNMTTAIDGITGVTNQSKFTIEDYGLAFAQAGGIAAGMGVNLADFNTVIAATATSFTSGGDAGTSFKTFLQRLANPTAKMKTLLDQLGISLFTDTGEMKDMKDVVGELHGAFAGMTEAQKAETAAQLGGADAARTVIALAGLTAAEFETLSKSVNDQGQAFRAAATRVDSFKGSMDIFKGVIEAVHIQIGDKFLPVLRRLTVGFTDLSSQHGPGIVAVFGKIADGITGLIDTGVGLVDAFGEHGLAGVFAELGLGGSALFLKKLTQLAGLMGLTEGNATSLGETIRATIGASFEWLSNNLFPTLSRGIQLVIDHFEEVKGAFVGIGAVLGASVLTALGAALFSLLTPLNLIIVAAGALGAAWAGNWGDIQGIVTRAWATIQPILTEFATGLFEIGRLLVTGDFRGGIFGLAEDSPVIDFLFGLREAALSIPSVIEKISRVATDLFTAFQAGGLFGSRSGSFGSAGLLAALGIDPAIIGVIETVFNTVTGLVNEFMTSGIFGGVALAGGEVARTGGILKMLGLSDETIGILQSTFNQITQTVQGFIATIGTSLSSLTASDVLTTLGTAFSTIGALAVQGLNMIVPALAELATWLSVNVPLAIQTLTTFWQTNWPIVQGVALTAWQILQGVFNGIVAAGQPVLTAFTQITAQMSSMGITWGDVGMALLAAAGVVFAGIGAAILFVIGVVTSFVSALAATTATIMAWSSTAMTAFVTFSASAIAAVQNFAAMFRALFSGDLPAAWQFFQQTLASAGVAIGSLFTGIGAAIMVPLSGVMTFLTTFGSSFIAFWQGLYDTLVGNSIVPDMVNSIISWFTSLPERVLGVIDGLVTRVTEAFGSITEIVGGLFGGGETQGSGMALSFDPAAMLEGLTLVQGAVTLLTTMLANIGLVTLPTLFAVFTSTATGIINLLLLVQQGVLTLTQTLDNISLVTMPTLLTASQVTTTGMVTGFSSIQPILQTLINLVTTLGSKITQLGSDTISAMEDVAEGFQDAGDDLGELIGIVEDATEAFWKMAEAAADAAAEASNAGDVSGVQTGIGFRRGVGFSRGVGMLAQGLGLGWTVPPGFPNDTFGPIFVESGEQMLVTPRGLTIDEVVMSRLGRIQMNLPQQVQALPIATPPALMMRAGEGGAAGPGTIYNFDMTVNTAASPQGVIRQYEVMKALVG